MRYDDGQYFTGITPLYHSDGSFKLYNEYFDESGRIKEEVMEKARAYGEREDEVWETAGYYYASRLFYNEEFDVMYEDGIVWVWSPTEDCYRTSDVTQW